MNFFILAILDSNFKFYVLPSHFLFYSLSVHRSFLFAHDSEIKTNSTTDSNATFMTQKFDYQHDFENEQIS